MKNYLLEIEVRLLILKYGYRNILSVLAKVKENSVEQVESLLRDIECREGRPKTVVQRNTLDVVEEIIKDHQNYELLKKLALGYDNKVFLPQLKDVKRLLERSKVDTKNIKSRMQATKKVFEVICDYSLAEIKEMVPIQNATNESAFSALAREIIDGSTK